MLDARVAIDEVRFVSENAFVISVRCPEIAREARPGHFVMIAPQESVDPLLRRPMAVYGVVREADEPVGISILVERTGRGTRLMARRRPGDLTRVLGPLGRPFEVAAGELEQVLVMGGVGSAPFPLLAREMRGRDLSVRAFIGGRTRHHLLCADELRALGVEVAVATDDGSEGHRGLVTEPLAAFLETSGPAALYSCGPIPMMRAVETIARLRGLPHQVSLEAPMACGIGVCLSCVVKARSGDSWSYRRICREGPVFDASTLLWE